MRAVLFLLSLALCAMGNASDLYFALLVRGNGARPPQGELEKMQEAHIGNFKRRFLEKKLIAAGPLQDPTERRRGIVVLTVNSFTEVADAFDGDPYVQGRIMNIESYRWHADSHKINTQTVDPGGVGENRLVDFTAKGEIPENLLAAHRTYMDKVASIYGRLDTTTPYHSIGLFSGADEPKLKAALAKDPLVKAGLLQAEILPLWMAKNSLK